MSDKITKLHLARMAGNIAAGIVAALIRTETVGNTTRVHTTQDDTQMIADVSVEIALRIAKKVEGLS